MDYNEPIIECEEGEKKIERRQNATTPMRRGGDQEIMAQLQSQIDTDSLREDLMLIHNPSMYQVMIPSALLRGNR